MEITITNCRYTPKWETLEKIIREAVGEPEESRGRITRISRCDKCCDYRQPGKFNLEFIRGDNTVLPIHLNIVSDGLN